MMTQYCNICGNELTNDNCYPSDIRRNRRKCIDCANEITKKWRKNNIERSREIVRESQYKQTNKKPMGKNILCSSYLGIYINEYILTLIYKDVKIMKNNNPGYDFICNHNMKIDAKSGCRRHNQGKSDIWHFRTNYNQIADYFLCVAFNNRKSLILEHIWIIPADIVKNKSGIYISESKLDKWVEYELLTDKIKLYSNILKKIVVNG